MERRPGEHKLTAVVLYLSLFWSWACFPNWLKQLETHGDIGIWFSTQVGCRV